MVKWTGLKGDWLLRVIVKRCMGIDYEETFSPVVRLASIRVLMGYTVQNDIITHQMDVTTAF